MRFRKDNQIKYSQDFCTVMGIGVPSGVDFFVERCGQGYSLRACGFGCLDNHTLECYGNGSLFAWGLTSAQRKRFEAVAQ